MSHRKKNIFVLGMNDFNRRKLNTLPEAESYRFHELLTFKESHGSSHYDIDRLMEKSIKRTASFDGPVDAILGFWDFPISIMQTILAERFGTAGTSPQSVLLCEQKLWSRIRQREVIPEMVPDFAGFNPFDENPRESIDLDYPFWVKPVKAFAGHLGFRVESDGDFDRAVRRIRRRVERFSKPFYRLLEYTDPPAGFVRDDPRFCIAESIIGGSQCTLEGYAFQGDIDMHGIIDSHRFPSSSSFSHYQYPSELPEGVHRRMRRAAKAIMSHVGFENSAFNIEFFWDKKSDDIKLLEINPRISQSHADLFHKVDGVSNHRIALAVNIGKHPDLPFREGPYEVAGKFFVRHFTNGIVRSAPGEEEVAEVREEIPDTYVELLAEKGQELEDLDYQDSYSYKLAIIYLGGDSREDLQRKFKKARDILGYDIEDKEED